MYISKLSNYKRGWVVGKFSPSLYDGDFEVGIQAYKAGDVHPAHFHKKATEINIVVKGKCIFTFQEQDGNYDVALDEGDILVVDTYESVLFTATTDCQLVVIKTKSVPNDKYEVKTISENNT